MDDTTEFRNAMEKHVYWSQFDPRKYHFYKIMKFFRFQLRLPKKFVMKFPVKIGAALKLRGPIGDVIREVKVVEAEEDVVLREGWVEFVDDHHLNEEDLLIFHYIGNMTFEVFVFDRNGCDKDLRSIQDEYDVKPQFWSKMRNLDIKSSKLLIPRKLVTNFPEKLFGEICLRGPSGNVWRVRTDWSDSEDVFLVKGWMEFVSDHELNVSDLLVFQYTGDSSFNILMFDKTGCEKESSHFVKPKSKCEQETKCEVNIKKRKGKKKSEIGAKEIRNRRLPKEVTLEQLNEIKMKQNQREGKKK